MLELQGNRALFGSEETAKALKFQEPFTAKDAEDAGRGARLPDTKKAGSFALGCNIQQSQVTMQSRWIGVSTEDRPCISALDYCF